jgi:hypothetical protein
MAGEELAFKAVFDIDMSDTMKKIEGTLPKIGRAIQKEMEGSISGKKKKSKSSIGKEWAGLAREGAAAMANPIGMIMQKLSPKLAASFKSAVQSATAGGYMKANYVYSGTRESVSGYSAQMARLGLAPDEDTIRYELQKEKARRERSFEAMKKVTEIAEQEFGGSLESELKELPKAMEKAARSTIQQFKDLTPVVSKFIKTLGKAVLGIDDFTKETYKTKNAAIFGRE